MMTDKTKITLSAKEQELVCNTDWFLTKQQIIQKVMELFAAVLGNMQLITAHQKADLPFAVFDKNPKISKGENYRGLPYIMLDYPRHFEKENTLAVRSLFWWGNFFSMSVQLSGQFKTAAEPGLLENFLLLQQQGFYICVNDAPWEHHFEADNYVSLQQVSVTAFTQLISQRSFIKMSKKIALTNWAEVPEFLELTFLEMMLLLKINYPNGETGL